MDGDLQEGEGEDFKFQTFVEEADELFSLVKAVSKPKDDNEASRSCLRLVSILEKYQEQPQLLDPHLEGMVTPLMEALRQDATWENSVYVQEICRAVYILCKVRSPKTIVKFFPHEASDLEATLDRLQKCQSTQEGGTWETKYVLLLWLSMIVLIPFDICSIDSSLAEGSGDSMTVVQRITNICQEHLGDTGKTSEGAAELLSRLLTRPDMRSERLAGFLEWAAGKLRSEDNPFLLVGIYHALAKVFKYGHRSELLDKISIIADAALVSHANSNSISLRKLSVKVAQRIGLTYLKPRVAKWRYERGSRSLLENLGKQGSGSGDQPEGGVGNNQDDEEDGDEDIEVPEEVESIIDTLLTGLRDRDTVVRWSAAKGVGRITGRLPRALADDVVESILDLPNDDEDDAAWHGGCLTLAELARRGLLLPKRLDAVMPIVLRALAYDVRKGAHSIGSHVRDSACYVVWAFARAYSPDIVAPYVQRMASSLIVASVFDREVNCRRAAAAAFQENVGRQGNFPHGIDILTIADYFTLANRQNAYLNISKAIAAFEEYTIPLITHLVDTKLSHWDRSLRELSAKALGVLTSSDFGHITTTVLPKLFPLTLDEDLPVRHGAVLGIAEIVLAVADIAEKDGKTAGDLLSEELQKDIRNVVPKIEKARLYRGRGGEVVRGASCRLTECIAAAKLPLQQKTVARLLDTVDENLKHPTEDISNAAVGALRAIANSYYEQCTEDFDDRLLNKYVANVKTDENVAVRRGYAMAIGALPRSCYKAHINACVDALVAATEEEEDISQRDAETRRNAVRGLGSLCITAGSNDLEEDLVTGEVIQKVGSALLNAMRDYATDNRGDVGSWVREEAMSTVEKVIVERAKSAPTTLSESFVSSVFQELIQQALEKIDRMREQAGTVLFNLMWSEEPAIPHIPHRDALRSLLPKDPPIDWSASSDTFPKLVNVLQYPEFRNSALEGLIVSVGGLTESLVKHSSASLITFLRQQVSTDGGKGAFDFLNSLLHVFQKHHADDRITVPLLKALDLLLSDHVFDPLGESNSDLFSSFCKDLKTELSVELKGCKDVAKLMVANKVYCGMVTPCVAKEVRDGVLSSLMIMLGHRYPKVRKAAAEQLYISFITAEELLDDDDKADSVFAELLETQWDGTIEDCREHRNALCDLLELPKPKATAAPSKPKSEPKKDEMESYSSLVHEMGY